MIINMQIDCSRASGKLCNLHRKLAIQAPGKLDVQAPKLESMHRKLEYNLRPVSDNLLLLYPTLSPLSGELHLENAILIHTNI